MSHSSPCRAPQHGGVARSKNIGETVRSNGEAETTIEQRCLTPPPAVPRSMTGGATQNIGEVARSDGGVNKQRG